MVALSMSRGTDSAVASLEKLGRGQEQEWALLRIEHHHPFGQALGQPRSGSQVRTTIPTSLARVHYRPLRRRSSKPLPLNFFLISDATALFNLLVQAWWMWGLCKMSTQQYEIVRTSPAVFLGWWMMGATLEGLRVGGVAWAHVSASEIISYI